MSCRRWRRLLVSLVPSMTKAELDPVTLAVIENGLVQVCNEMDLAFSRAAFSPVIAEANDRSDGIYAAQTGELIAQGELGLPVFVGTMQYSTRAVIDAIREGRAAPAEEGDVFILNDPYLGGTHLMDVKFVEPFFHEGRLFCWLANTGHWPDIGGTVPGGFSANATEVRAGGSAAAAGEALPQGRARPGPVAGDPGQHPGAGAARRRHPGPEGGAECRQAAPLGPARALRSAHHRGRHRRAAGPRRAADAQAHRADPGRHLRGHGGGRQRRGGRRAAPDPAQGDEGGHRSRLRPFRLQPALPRAR